MKKVIAFSLLIVIGFTAQGQDTKLSRTVTKSFSLPQNGSVRIVNKYGPVTISTWNKDSVKVEIVTTAWGKNDKNVDKMMRRVDFDFIQSSRYLELSTVLDRSSGFFAELWNNIGDYSKTLLSQNKLKIEYKVSLPAHLDLEIENKFGDVYMSEYSGKLRVTLAHGNLRGNKLSQLDLDLSFGNADVKSIREATLLLKGTECTFTSLGNATITTSSSDLEIREATFIKIDSRSDRNVQIDKIAEIHGNGNFSKIEIQEVTDVIRLDLSYGELDLGPVQSFQSITLTGNNTPMTLRFEQSAGFEFEIEGEEDKVQFPSNVNPQQSYVNDKDNQTRFTGRIGSPSGKLRVYSGNGDVTIVLLK